MKSRKLRNSRKVRRTKRVRKSRRVRTRKVGRSIKGGEENWRSRFSARAQLDANEKERDKMLRTIGSEVPFGTAVGIRGTTTTSDGPDTARVPRDAFAARRTQYGIDHVYN